MKILTRNQQREAILKIATMGTAWIKTNRYLPLEEKDGLVRMQAEYLVDLANIIGGLDGVNAMYCALSGSLDKRKLPEEGEHATD